MIQDIAPYSYHVEYHNISPLEKDAVLSYKDGRILIARDEREELVFPGVGECSCAEYTYLFSIDEVRFFVPHSETIEEFSEYRFEPVRKLRLALPRWKAFAASVGFQLDSWYRRNRFCGCCGRPLIQSETERALSCPSCGNLIYPAIAPSVIVAVTAGEKLLLTRYQASHSSYRHYALVAGYVETGETAEDTVRREVLEEVGLHVKNIRYYKSQPWGFSGALLLGFFCEADESEPIVLDKSELCEAVWVRKEDLPDRSGDVSLTSEMMECVRLDLC